MDHFNRAENPAAALENLLLWAGRPVDFIAEHHNQVLRRWKKRCPAGSGSAPSHILHVDEHHDMIDERPTANIGNVMYQAMRTRPYCKVHRLVQEGRQMPALFRPFDLSCHARFYARNRRFSPARGICCKAIAGKRRRLSQADRSRQPAPESRSCHRRNPAEWVSCLYPAMWGRRLT